MSGKPANKQQRSSVKRDLRLKHYSDRELEERAQVDAADIERARNLWYTLAPDAYVHLLDAHTSYEPVVRGQHS